MSCQNNLIYLMIALMTMSLYVGPNYPDNSLQETLHAEVYCQCHHKIVEINYHQQPSQDQRISPLRFQRSSFPFVLHQTL